MVFVTESPLSSTRWNSVPAASLSALRKSSSISIRPANRTIAARVIQLIAVGTAAEAACTTRAAAALFEARGRARIHTADTHSG